MAVTILTVLAVSVGVVGFLYMANDLCREAAAKYREWDKKKSQRTAKLNRVISKFSDIEDELSATRLFLRLVHPPHDYMDVPKSWGMPPQVQFAAIKKEIEDLHRAYRELHRQVYRDKHRLSDNVKVFEDNTKFYLTAHYMDPLQKSHQAILELDTKDMQSTMSDIINSTRFPGMEEVVEDSKVSVTTVGGEKCQL